MESRQLTQFGKRTKERLNRINRDDEWLLRQLKKKGISIDKARYEAVIYGDVKSRPHEISIGKLITEEEDIQRIAKMLGIKRG